MDTVALFVRLQARKGKEAEVEKFLKDALTEVQNELETSTWYAFRIDASTYGIFDSFPDDKGREAHLSGKLAKKLMEKSPELFVQAPVVDKLDLLAIKMPEVVQY